MPADITEDIEEIDQAIATIRRIRYSKDSWWCKRAIKMLENEKVERDKWSKVSTEDALKPYTCPFCGLEEMIYPLYVDHKETCNHRTFLKEPIREPFKL